MATPIMAAGGVVFRTYASKQKDAPPEVEVLLIYRRDNWDLPKGKREEGENHRTCAIREVREEVGVNSVQIVSDLGTTYHEYERGEIRYGKTTYWYAMQLEEDEDFTPQTEEDIEKVQWVPVTEAKERVAFDNLMKLLDRFEVWFWERWEIESE